jgi:hypothetical protein
MSCVLQISKVAGVIAQHGMILPKTNTTWHRITTTKSVLPFAKMSEMRSSSRTTTNRLFFLRCLFSGCLSAFPPFPNNVAHGVNPLPLRLDWLRTIISNIGNQSVGDGDWTQEIPQQIPLSVVRWHSHRNRSLARRSQAADSNRANL